MCLLEYILDLDICTVIAVSNGTISIEGPFIALKGLTAEECRKRCESNPDCEEASFRNIPSSICFLYDKHVNVTDSAPAGSFHFSKTCIHGKLILKQ